MAAKSGGAITNRKKDIILTVAVNHFGWVKIFKK